ncbi:hypothetical protein CEXT_673941 [Caerostris extrusa]|uniref:Uncharacterized protein n=1 Tax=Caerostris extrusa TaxID=172846 RepID=A0AAV4X8C3_CAEEX|nr:hypothetical protein CEXT_673941 [Caerostris extrusa]
MRRRSSPNISRNRCWVESMMGGSVLSLPECYTTTPFSQRNGKSGWYYRTSYWKRLSCSSGTESQFTSILTEDHRLPRNLVHYCARKEDEWTKRRCEELVKRDHAGNRKGDNQERDGEQ